MASNVRVPVVGGSSSRSLFYTSKAHRASSTEMCKDFRQGVYSPLSHRPDPVISLSEGICDYFYRRNPRESHRRRMRNRPVGASEVQNLLPLSEGGSLTLLLLSPSRLHNGAPYSVLDITACIYAFLIPSPGLLRLGIRPISASALLPNLGTRELKRSLNPHRPFSVKLRYFKVGPTVTLTAPTITWTGGGTF